MRFDQRYAYDSRLNRHNKNVEEFWSLREDEQLALQEIEIKDLILKETKKAIKDVVDGMALGKKVREKERHWVDTDDEFFLTSLKNDKPLIPSEKRNLSITESFPSEKDSDQVPTFNFKACRPRNKLVLPLPSDRQTHAMISFSKLRFCYIGGIGPSHQHIHKVLDPL